MPPDGMAGNFRPGRRPGASGPPREQARKNRSCLTMKLAYFLDYPLTAGIPARSGQAMNLFFLMPRPSGRGDDLLNAVAPFAAGGRLEVFYDLDGFAARMRRPKGFPSVAVIWDPNRGDLRRIGAMKDHLAGVRTVLVLNDQNKETISLAHRLRPAYIAYIDDAIPEIVSVLERLAGSRDEGARS
jgi:hypothetical protein